MRFRVWIWIFIKGSKEFVENAGRLSVKEITASKRVANVEIKERRIDEMLDCVM